MPRKKKQKVESNYPPDWRVAEYAYWNGRHIRPGTELSITGERGRFRFVKFVETPTATWIDVIGGKHNLSRSFHPSRIKTVHRIKKTRENAA